MHLILSARVITFVTIAQLCFMLHTLMHSKSIFLGPFQRCFLHLFVFLLKCALRVPFLVNTYLHRSHFFCLQFHVSLFFMVLVYLFQNIYIHTHHTGTPDLYLSSDGLLEFPSICICKFSFQYIGIHTGYTHVGPYSQSQLSHGLTTRYKQVTKVQQYWQVSQAWGHGKIIKV